ncbi:MAG: helix-turn-helix domain-containing protein [Lachnospiraceae bacterium]|nr:helix-turn-helix domain-containing protein [Lachnospiraceae bacterium]
MGEFKNVFKSLRLKSGLTQQQMADALKLSRSTIGMYENGEREPGFEILESIADYFNVDMNYLLGKKDYSQVIAPDYYYNKDASSAAQFLFENPEYKVLFDASRKVKKEDIDFVADMINRVNGNHDDME